jgi:hypothetical protein
MAIKVLNPLGRDDSKALAGPYDQQTLMLNILLELRQMNEWLSGRADPNSTTQEVRVELMSEVI